MDGQKRPAHDIVQPALLVLAALSILGGMFLFYGSTVRGEDALAARIQVIEEQVSHLSNAVDGIGKILEDVRIALANKVDRK